MMVAQTVGVAVEVEHHGAVKESVEHGCGDGGVAEDLTVTSNLNPARTGRRLRARLEPLEPGRARLTRPIRKLAVVTEYAPSGLTTVFHQMRRPEQTAEGRGAGGQVDDLLPAR